MRPSAIVSAVIVALLLAAAAVDAQISPYAGQQTRAIKALSAQEIDDLLNARGMALAKAAELNGYPGPLHSLEMASELGLTAEQLRLVRDIKARVDAATTPVGVEIVARERELDQLFATRAITKARLEALTATLGELQGRLRGLHLAAHLEVTAALNADQIARYDRLRGYSTGDAQPEHNPVRRHGN